MSRGEERYHCEYRATPARLWYPTVACTIASAGLVLRMATGGVSPAVTIRVAVLFAALLAWMRTALRGTAKVLEERGVTIRRPRLYGGDIAVAWTDVQGIETEVNRAAGMWGAQRRVVVIYASGGRRRVLPYLYGRNGLDVAQEAATLRGLWTLGRGENWVPSGNGADGLR